MRCVITDKYDSGYDTEYIGMIQGKVHTMIEIRGLWVMGRVCVLCFVFCV